MIARRFVAPELRALDALEADVALAAYWEDVRPMGGLAGLCDFRLAGRLSALLRDAFVRGEAGEALMVPPRPRLPFDKLVLVGLGPRAAFGDDAFRAGLARMARAAAGLGARRPVVELPGRGDDTIPAARAAELAEEGDGAALLDGAWLVERPEGHAAFRTRR